MFVPQKYFYEPQGLILSCREEVDLSKGRMSTRFRGLGSGEDHPTPKGDFKPGPAGAFALQAAPLVYFC